MPEQDLNNFKVIEGVIVAVNPERRGIAIRNEHGITTGGKWDPSRDKEFLRLQKYWFARITFEKRGADLIAIAQASILKPEWYKPLQKHPGKEPDNLPAIMASVLFKGYCELYPHCMVPDEVDFTSARNDILAAVKTDLPDILKTIREAENG